MAEQLAFKASITLLNTCIRDMSVAITNFGLHPFFDRGPQEVLNLNSLTTKFRNLPGGAEQASATLLALYRVGGHNKKAAQLLAETILEELLDWGEFQTTDIVKELWGEE